MGVSLERAEVPFAVAGRRSRGQGRGQLVDVVVLEELVGPVGFGWSAAHAASADFTVGLEVLIVDGGVELPVVPVGPRVGKVTPWSFRQFL